MRVAINGNLVCKYLNDMKKKHGLSNKRWAEMSGVPLGTINRYMSYNVGVPSFMYVCALLECLGESMQDFYTAVNIAIENTPPTTVPGTDVINVAEEVAASPPDPTVIESMQEAISAQSDILVEQTQNSLQREEKIDDLRSDFDKLNEKTKKQEIEITRLKTELAQKKKQCRVLIAILLVLAVLEVLLANVGFVRGLF